MTGYGRAEAVGEKIAISVEARSLNHRHLDIALKLPRPLAGFEVEARRLVQGKVQRGRLEVSAAVASLSAGSGRVKANVPLAREYLQGARSLAESLEINGDVPLDWILRCPGVLDLDDPEPLPNEEGWPLLSEALTRAMSELVGCRENEGETIRKEIDDLHGRLAAEIERMAVRVQASSDNRQKRLRERIAALLGDTTIDEGRLAMEVAIQADRADITEELARLRAHLAEWSRLVREGGSVGRTMDFLIQEMNREVNTIASKADDLELSQAAIAAKSLLEKLREQAQNLE
jgi:uncharacterized protein (TIGR00255 family)